MAAWIDKKISLLVLVTIVTSVMAAEWAIFREIEAQQGHAVANVVGALVRDESLMSRSYLLAQSLEDFQAFGTVQCALLAERNDHQVAVFYDSTFKSDCDPKKLIRVQLPGLNGRTWELAVQPILGLKFYLMKWLTLFLSLILVLTAYRLIVQLIGRERRRRLIAETQKSLLEELALQVRHDVASPITALRLIAEKAPLEAEMRDFLKLAVQRTQGIFETLSQIKVGAEPLWLKNEIEQIQREKRGADPQFPEVEHNLTTERLMIQKVEFGRAISNLFDNAKSAGASIIRIKGKSLADSFRLTIDDDGDPVPRGVLARIGERGNTAGKKNGSGYGIYHCHRFMNSVGGTMTVQARDPKVQLDFPNGLIVG